jgi:hypothetical protein
MFAFNLIGLCRVSEDEENVEKLAHKANKKMDMKYNI